MRAPWRWLAAQVHLVVWVALLAWTAFECFGPAPSEAIASSTYDKMQQHRLWASAPDPRLLIVDVDERSLADMSDEFGRWPWPRDTLAVLLEHARTQRAAAVVFDILFSDADRFHPGGDRALEAAVRAGDLGHFPVLRLPEALDAASKLRVDELPRWLVRPSTAGVAPPVALVLPFMEAMIESGRLGTHTAKLEADGKIRRFAFEEVLARGWTLPSIPAAVAATLNPAAVSNSQNRLIVWRKSPGVYPRVPFSVAWQCAERRPRSDCPDLAGRILIVGATASSLHDVKSTPLANQHMGVDILATLVDNALHERSFRELSSTVRWLLSVAALSLAFAVVRYGAADATGRTLWLLPTALLGIGFASLHSETFYLDLSLPAAAVLTFLSIVKLHDALRRQLYGLKCEPVSGSWALLCSAAARHAESLERHVFDVAAKQGLRVSGTKAVAGAHGEAHATWILWGGMDEPASAELARHLQQLLPETGCRVFQTGAEPRRDALEAAALVLPAPEPAPSGVSRNSSHANA